VSSHLRFIYRYEAKTYRLDRRESGTRRPRVKTKFRKTFATYFFPVGDEIRQIVTDWVHYLRIEKLWGLDDPLFPRTRVAVGASGHFEAVGLDRNGWSNATPIHFQGRLHGGGPALFQPA
jgi:hypothetical protein